MSRPSHIILIQADDLGIDDLGFSGNPLAHTPNIDRLAKGAVQALDFTVNPVCAPSRASLLTGRHFLKTGVSHVHGGKDFLHLEERIFPQVLRDHGWRTGMWGKWHLGRGRGYEPWERGFDEAYAADLYQHRATTGQFNGTTVQHGSSWCDDAIVDYAIEFIRRDPSKPAFVYLPTMTPHGPLDAPEHWVEFHRQRGQTPALATLNAMVTALDEAIGRLIDDLKAAGVWESTLLIVTSDNGPAINRGIMTDEERRLRKIGARRGWKGDIWENGVRAPLLMHWPEHLGASVLRQPLDQIDLLPTLLEWCQCEWPTDFPELDGVSRCQEIERARELDDPEESVSIFNYAHPGWITSRRAYDPAGIPSEYNPVHPEHKAKLAALEQPISIRKGRYKFLLNPYPPESNQSPHRVLIDLLEDPGESTNLAAAQPEAAASLEAELVQWFETVKQEAHAFTAPVFQILSNAPTQIPARMPFKVEGSLQNTVTDLRGWENGPAEASYQIDASACPNASSVSLVIHASAPLPDGLQFTVQCGESTVAAQSVANSKQIRFEALKLSPKAQALTVRQSQRISDGESATIALECIVVDRPSERV